MPVAGFGSGFRFAAVDSTPPAVSGSPTIDATGTTLSISFTEAVFGTASLGWTLALSGGAVTVSGGSGSGTTTLTLSLSRTVLDDETGDVDYSSSTGDLHDAANNDLATFSNTSITNNSTQTEEEEELTTLLDTSFEGATGTNWGTPVSGTWVPSGPAGTEARGLLTMNAGTTPTGGGDRVLKQVWHPSVPSGWAPEGMIYTFASSLTEGEIVRLDFWYYHSPTWVWSEGETLKMIIFKPSSGSNQYYWNSHHEGDMCWTFPAVGSGSVNYSNIGGRYTIPEGQWEHFVYEMKIATEGQSAVGYVRVTINDELRFDYSNIHTVNTGEAINKFQVNWTYNDQILDTDNYRYFDLFKVYRG